MRPSRPTVDGRADRDGRPARPAAGGPISFLSDYGLEDEFVGVVHRVIAAHAPGVAVIDVTHQIPAHDVRAGALTLWRAAPWLVPGVILAVVDPGVGTARRAVAIEVAGGRRRPRRPRQRTPPPRRHLPRPPHRPRWSCRPTRPAGRGATFAGRDVFAPAAAGLAAGRRPRPPGPAHRPGQPGSATADPVLRGRTRTARLGAEVLWVDRFGNAQLNVRPATPTTSGPVVDPARPGRHRAGPPGRRLRRARARRGGAGHRLLRAAGRQLPGRLRLRPALGLPAGDPVWLRPGPGG